MIGKRQKSSLIWVVNVLSQDLLFFAAIVAIGLSSASLLIGG